MSFNDQMDWDAFLGGITRGLSTGTDIAAKQQAMQLRQYDIEGAERKKQMLDEIMQIPVPDMSTNAGTFTNRSKYAEQVAGIMMRNGNIQGAIETTQKFYEHNHRQLISAMRDAGTWMKMGDFNRGLPYVQKMVNWTNTGPGYTTIRVNDDNTGYIADNYDDSGKLVDSSAFDNEDLSVIYRWASDQDAFYDDMNRRAQMDNNIEVAETNQAGAVLRAVGGGDGKGRDPYTVRRDRQSDLDKAIKAYGFSRPADDMYGDMSDEEKNWGRQGIYLSKTIDAVPQNRHLAIEQVPQAAIDLMDIINNEQWDAVRSTEDGEYFEISGPNVGVFYVPKARVPALARMDPDAITAADRTAYEGE